MNLRRFDLIHKTTLFLWNLKKEIKKWNVRSYINIEKLKQNCTNEDGILYTKIEICKQVIAEIRKIEKGGFQ